MEQGSDRYGSEYKRTDNDFGFRWLDQDNCICDICHGTGGKDRIQICHKKLCKRQG